MVITDLPISKERGPVMKMTSHARQLMLAVGERQFRHSQVHGTRPLWRLAAALGLLWFVARASLPVDQRSTAQVLHFAQPIGWTVLLAAPLMVLVLSGPLDWWGRTLAYEGWSFIWRAARFVVLVVPVVGLALTPLAVHFHPAFGSLPVIGNVASWGDIRFVLAVVVWLAVYDCGHSMLALAYTSQDPSLKTELDWSVKWVLVGVQLVFTLVGKVLGLVRRLAGAAHGLARAHKGPATHRIADVVDEDEDDEDYEEEDVDEVLAAMRGSSAAYVYADAT